MPLTPILLPHAELLLDPEFLPLPEATALLEELTATIPWKQEAIRLFGKEVPQPRLTAWHGDAGATYRYSGLQLTSQPWTATLQELRQRVEAATEAQFNSVLLNLYRTGQDSMGWHADNEPELGARPVIASVSLGATRNFRLRPRDPLLTPHPPVSLPLTSGSLVLMRGTTQEAWLHGLPKTARVHEPRLNLTFRMVLGHSKESN